MQDALRLFRYVKRIGQLSNPFFDVSNIKKGISCWHTPILDKECRQASVSIRL
jgi:hypothetical protein